MPRPEGSRRSASHTNGQSKHFTAKQQSCRAAQRLYSLCVKPLHPLLLRDKMLPLIPLSPNRNLRGGQPCQRYAER